MLLYNSLAVFSYLILISSLFYMDLRDLVVYILFMLVYLLLICVFPLGPAEDEYNLLGTPRTIYNFGICIDNFISGDRFDQPEADITDFVYGATLIALRNNPKMLYLAIICPFILYFYRKIKDQYIRALFTSAIYI